MATKLLSSAAKLCSTPYHFLSPSPLPRISLPQLIRPGSVQAQIRPSLSGEAGLSLSASESCIHSSHCIRHAESDPSRLRLRQQHAARQRPYSPPHAESEPGPSLAMPSRSASESIHAESDPAWLDSDPDLNLATVSVRPTQMCGSLRPAERTAAVRLAVRETRWAEGW